MYSSKPEKSSDTDCFPLHAHNNGSCILDLRCKVKQWKHSAARVCLYEVERLPTWGVGVKDGLRLVGAISSVSGKLARTKKERGSPRETRMSLVPEDPGVLNRLPSVKLTFCLQMQRKPF